MTTARRVRRACLALIGGGFVMAAGLSAHAQQPDAVPTLGDADRVRILAHIDGIGRRGFLYEVARPAADGSVGKRLFLYGTIHVGQPDSDPFNAPLMKALSQSRRLALEADPTDLAATQRVLVQEGMYGADDTLGRHVPPDLLARATAFGVKAGLPADRVEHLKPWLLGIMIAGRRIGSSGLDADLGTELYLAGYAHGVHLPIVEIEGMQTQLRLFAGLPDALQTAELVEAPDDDDADDAQNDPRLLFDLWFAGDTAAAATMLADLRRDARDKVFERYFVDILIDARNRSMADRAEHYLERPGNTFFAVGTLHLFGETGLLQEFERRGYRVVDLQAPPAAR